METARFDVLSRALSRERSRRTALAALLAGPLALLGVTETTAKHKQRNPCKGKPDDTPCKGDGRCLLGVCNPRPTCGGLDRPSLAAFLSRTSRNLRRNGKTSRRPCCGCQICGARQAATATLCGMAHSQIV